MLQFQTVLIYSISLALNMAYLGWAAADDSTHSMPKDETLKALEKQIPTACGHWDGINWDDLNKTFPIPADVSLIARKIRRQDCADIKKIH